MSIAGGPEGLDFVSGFLEDGEESGKGGRLAKAHAIW